jgi:hypothetical protein
MLETQGYRSLANGAQIERFPGSIGPAGASCGFDTESRVAFTRLSGFQAIRSYGTPSPHKTLNTILLNHADYCVHIGNRENDIHELSCTGDGTHTIGPV